MTPALLNKQVEPAELLLDGGEQRRDRVGIADVAAWAKLRRPIASISRAAAAIGSSRRPVSATFQPARASASADALPMPRPPPVISANLSVLMFPPVFDCIAIIAARRRARQSRVGRRSSGASRQTAAAITKAAADQRRAVGHLAESEQHPERSHHDVEHRDQRRLGRRHDFGAFHEQRESHRDRGDAEHEQHAEVEGGDRHVRRDGIAETRRDQRRQRVDRRDRQSGIAPLQNDEQRERRRSWRTTSACPSMRPCPSPPATMTTIPTIARPAAISVRREARSPVIANAMPAAKNGSVA